MRTLEQQQTRWREPVSFSLARPRGLDAASGALEVAGTSHDFSLIPINAESPARRQAKLTAGAPADAYEQEADRMAAAISTPHHTPGGAPSQIRRVAWHPAAALGAAPASVGRALADHGSPLEPALQKEMGKRFGHDFSKVRLHSGPLAEESAQEIGARAYTVGHDVVFGAGGFAPGTQEGRRLLAHELTHVVQQSAAGRSAAPLVQRQPLPTGAGGNIADPTAFFNRMLSHPSYIDNNMKEVNFYTAEQADVHYSDGSMLRLGLVKKWMEPPVVEVDYHTPREGYRPYMDAKQNVSFFRESDLQNVPRNMTYEEMIKRYAQRVDFVADGKSGRIVPTRVNTLTAPKLCRVLLDSERRYVERAEWVAEWGIKVAGVVGGMGAGTYGPGVAGGVGREVAAVEAQAARRTAAREAGQAAETVAGREAGQAAQTAGGAAAKKLTSGEIGGEIIGWGTGQTAEAVLKTQQATKAITANRVKEMISQGLTKEWVEKQLGFYTGAVAKGGTKLKNTQLFARKELMEKILSLWPN